jgi:membrane protein DedA with SNARE-associated domain
VVAGKFVGVVRPLVPPLAGILRLPYRRFVAASALASALWTALLVTIGALAGSSATRWVDTLGRVGWVVLAIGVPVAMVIALRRVRRARVDDVTALAPA